jgi:hypothetical protein
VTALQPITRGMVGTEVAGYAPRWVFATPRTIYGAETLLALIWAVLTRDHIWTGPETYGRGD